MAEYPIIPIICGPTASGKTSVTLELAEDFPLEVVSADSRQIIKHLDIGTAKPTRQEREQVPVHLVDLIEPGERYSAFRFISDATRVIGEIIERGNQPIVVGGTGLYLRALTEGVVEIENEDISVRERLEQEWDTEGGEKMHSRLAGIDPPEAAKIHPNNRQRVIRALEIFYLTGKTKSEIITTGAHFKSPYRFECFCLAPDRAELYERVNVRVDQMMSGGLLDELQALVDEGSADRIRSANVIGYSELLDYIERKTTLDEAVALIKQNTRRFAKRQMTWFRGQSECAFYRDNKSLREALNLLSISR